MTDIHAMAVSYALNGPFSVAALHIESLDRHAKYVWHFILQPHEDVE